MKLVLAAAIVTLASCTKPAETSTTVTDSTTVVTVDSTTVNTVDSTTTVQQSDSAAVVK